MKRPSPVKRVISKDKEKEFSKVRPASNFVSSKKAVDEKMLFETSPLLSRKIVPNSLEPKKVTFLEDKRPVHTLSADGYQGVLGRYNLILSQEEGGYKVLTKSKFTFAFATK
ncbi:MAG: hypothetical protein BGO77_01950 [Caedibacter sp. 37-49]|nr:MAG: hypothetical protein BGO77_01950 [Caedibacter sp. 37-49]